MSRIQVSEGATVSRVNQEILVNGQLRTDIFCVTVQQAITRGAATAVFSVPRLSLGSNVDLFDDAEVVVYAWHNTDPKPQRPIFRGFTQKHTTVANAKNNGIVFTAISTFGQMKNVYVGHNTNNGELIFKREDNWTFLGIMEYLFSDVALSNPWRSKIRLGNLRGLDASDFITSDVSFPAESYFDAVYRLLSLAGNIRLVETFTSTRSEINLLEFGDPTLPLRVVRIPARGLGPSQGAIVTDIRRTVDHERIVSGVRAYGHPKRNMITLRTPEFEEADVPVGKHLEPAWANASAYVDTALGSGTQAERDVLLQPGLATPANKPLYETATAAQRYCYRVFRLPEAIRRLAILDKNVKQTFEIVGEEEGRKLVNLPIQVWVEDFRLVDAAVTPNVDKIWDASNYDRRLIEGVKFTDDGFMILPEPAVSVRRISSFEGEVSKLYNRATLYVTLSVMSRMRRPFYDTGIRGTIDFDGISEAGIYDEFINENIFFDVMGTETDEIPGPGGTALTYGCEYFDEYTKTWETVAEGTPETVVNQLPFLKIYAERHIAERSSARLEYRLRLPVMTTAIQPMHRLLVDGRILQVASVQQVVSDHQGGVSTQIVAVDAMPHMQTQTVPVQQAQQKQEGITEAQRKQMKQLGSTMARTLRNKSIPRFQQDLAATQQRLERSTGEPLG